MNIQLEKWKVVEIKLTLLEENSIREDNSFDLQVANLFSEDTSSKVFIVVFEIRLSDKYFDLYTKAIFTFSVDENVSEEFKLSSFPKINAPAIAFPYLRAFISNLTLQSGLKPVILPSINFVEFGRKNMEKESG